MASTPPTLTYFNIEAAAEKVRLAFVLTGTDFKDERIEFKDWGDRKKDTPYGQLPTLSLPSESDRLIAQSGAMARYICVKYDQTKELYPVGDVKKLLEVDEMIGLVEDFMRAWMPALYLGMRHTTYGYPEEWPEKAATVKMLRERFIAEDLPKFMAFFKVEIGKGTFLCGDKITLADLWLVPQLRYFTKGVADNVPSTVLEPYPEITSYLARFLAVPAVEKWYAGK